MLPTLYPRACAGRTVDTVLPQAGRTVDTVLPGTVAQAVDRSRHCPKGLPVPRYPGHPACAPDCCLSASGSGPGEAVMMVL